MGAAKPTSQLTPLTIETKWCSELDAYKWNKTSTEYYTRSGTALSADMGACQSTCIIKCRKWLYQGRDIPYAHDYPLLRKHSLSRSSQECVLYTCSLYACLWCTPRALQIAFVCVCIYQNQGHANGSYVKDFVLVTLLWERIEYLERTKEPAPKRK